MVLQYNFLWMVVVYIVYWYPLTEVKSFICHLQF